MSKGSRQRPYDYQKFSNNWENIFRKPVQEQAVEESEEDTAKQAEDVRVSTLQGSEARS